MTLIRTVFHESTIACKTAHDVWIIGRKTAEGFTDKHTNLRYYAMIKTPCLVYCTSKRTNRLTHCNLHWNFHNLVTITAITRHFTVTVCLFKTKTTIILGWTEYLIKDSCWPCLSFTPMMVHHVIVNKRQTLRFPASSIGGAFVPVGRHNVRGAPSKKGSFWSPRRPLKKYSQLLSINHQMAGEGAKNAFFEVAPMILCLPTGTKGPT